MIETDLLVVGSGAAGFSAALTASHAGLNVLMVEKEKLFGGTTAYSAGVIWIPGNRHGRALGIADSKEEALTYLQNEAGNRLNLELANAFLDNCNPAVEFIENNTHVRYEAVPIWADYHPTKPGAAQGGRSLLPLPFDGRRLGKRFNQLRAPLRTMMAFGGMMLGRNDLPHVFKMTRSARSALHVAGMTARYAIDRLNHDRGTRLTNGNGLIAALALSAQERGIELWLESPVVELVQRDGDVAGAIVQRDGKRQEIHARRGVVLACGGFPADDELKGRYYGHVRAGHFHRSAPPPGNRGDGIRLGQSAGGAMAEDVAYPAAWVPVSLVPQPDGSSLPFPHFYERGKPGYIAVDPTGRRFANESASYHDFVPAMVEACRGRNETSAWLLCDHRAIRRYGMGAIGPAPLPLGPHIRNGYLLTAASWAELAGKIGVDSAALQSTIGHFNANAARGEDPDFGKGTDAYHRFNGDPTHSPNPCLAPLEQGPFYAMKMVPGDIGTFLGLRVDGHARVLDARGTAIRGLYAAGNDMTSVMGGTYPGAGITIGPALTFGYIAARHAAAEAAR
ncbi:MAG: FAD binding domain-containing protein 15 [Rhodospirillaceae bacterium]|nr:MAG: FAD binding domain-containing protein 15 [Rhodospirillaceae bacterium]